MVWEDKDEVRESERMRDREIERVCGGEGFWSSATG